MQAKKERVLYIDEDVESGFVFDTLLRLADYDTVTVNVGTDALQRARSEPFDLFVFSKEFPVDSGVYLYRKLRELAPQTPVLFLPKMAEAFNLQGYVFN